MKNKKILTAVVISTIAIVGISSSFADYTNEQMKLNEMKNKMHDFRGKKLGKRGFGHKNFNRGFNKNNLTIEERKNLELMNMEEKKKFFAKKREENKIKREAREIVIDNLLIGKTLTQEQEIIRAEIIKNRAERKSKRIEREKRKAEMKAIFEKKRAGETLTKLEEEKLKQLKLERQNRKNRRSLNRRNR